MLKMTPKVRRLTAQLRVARWRVRRLEMMLILSRRVAVARCEHDWEKVYPSGPRVHFHVIKPVDDRVQRTANIRAPSRLHL